MTPHPMQPIVNEDGVLRFKANKIVRAMLDFNTLKGWMDMNAIAILPFSDEDRAQFAQLIGYSVSGAADLSYMPDDVIAKARKEGDELLARKEESQQ